MKIVVASYCCIASK